jgi:DNA-binding LacI/PurR family transcriptional regulator
VGAYRALRQLYLEPGRDIAVIGLRDNPACQSLLPKLTCFKLDLEALGLALSEAVVATLADPTNADFSHLQRRWPMGLELGSSHDPKTSLTPESNAQV